MSLRKFIIAALCVVMITVLGGGAFAGAGVVGITNVSVGTPVVVGSSTMVTWNSNGVSEVTLALEKDGRYVKNLLWNIPSTGSVSWTPDPSIKPGNGYQIVVTQAGSSSPYTPAISARSKKFSIKIVLNKFVNLDGGYSFKYPSFWNAVPGIPNTNKNTIFGPNAYMGFALGGVAVIPHSGSLDEYLKGRGDYLGLFYIDQNKTKIDGHDAIVAKDSATLRPIVFIKNGDQVITVYFNSNNPDEIKLFENLVEGFHILEPKIEISFDRKTKTVNIVSENIPNDPYHHYGIEYKYPNDSFWRGLLAYGTTNGKYSFRIGTTPSAGVYVLEIPIEIRVTAFEGMRPFLSETLKIKR
ncbi:MAG: GPI anchored serine-threonine rich family protein [Janthinobacterium sp.]|jgi:hypothetical protein